LKNGKHVEVSVEAVLVLQADLVAVGKNEAEEAVENAVVVVDVVDSSLLITTAMIAEEGMILAVIIEVKMVDGIDLQDVNRETTPLVVVVRVVLVLLVVIGMKVAVVM
jgi:hypothetical protein